MLQLERWAASIEDYENLLDHVPGDEEISKALTDAQAKLKKQQEAALSGMINSGDSHLIRITAEDQFRHIIMSSGKAPTVFSSL